METKPKTKNQENQNEMKNQIQHTGNYKRGANVCVCSSATKLILDVN